VGDTTASTRSLFFWRLKRAFNGAIELDNKVSWVGMAGFRVFSDACSDTQPDNVPTTARGMGSTWYRKRPLAGSSFRRSFISASFWT